MWPMGFGALTMLGMKQEYELGHYIRKTYGKILPENYAKVEKHFIDQWGSQIICDSQWPIQPILTYS